MKERAGLSSLTEEKWKEERKKRKISAVTENYSFAVHNKNTKWLIKNRSSSPKYATSFNVILQNLKHFIYICIN